MKPLAISCSGGGALGIGPARLLSNIECDIGKKISSMSVGYAGTSTGAILAGCLDEEISALDIFDMYKNNLKKIFTKYGVIDKVKKYPCPTYDNSYLKKLLKEKLVGKMSDWKKPIFIPSFNIISVSNPEKVFDRGDSDVDKWFSVLASTSAETYFFPAGNDMSLIDGGNFANNPIAILAAGMNDARKSSYGRNIKILHLDTGMTIDKKGTGGNKNTIEWAVYIFKKLVARSNQSATYIAKQFLGEENVCVASPVVKKEYDMDDLDCTDEIVNIWDNYYKNNKDSILKFVQS